MSNSLISWPHIQRIARKETSLFFSSPMGWLFLAVFVGVTLFVIFWGESFFARNIADVRPLFEWMPILLIFLCSALTMRQWSEERRTGTLEHVLTLPVPIAWFVIGKFLAGLKLLATALLITLPFPLTLSLYGDVDWGPVIAGYLATLLLGGSYLSMGLFMSSRTDNPVVALLLSTLLCGIFYGVGTPVITNVAPWLACLGTGVHFESIARGVLSIPDIAYYLSLIIVFLSLNAFSLERTRWATRRPNHRMWRLIIGLFIANAIALNAWLTGFPSWRVDMTQSGMYSISPVTKRYLDQLEEPLLIRGYFTDKTHPLLAPLVPQIKDLLQEYAVVGGNKVRVEIIDPQQDTEAAAEAAQTYQIEPTPFQVEGRYESSIVSSYFNILIQYGSEHRVLGFTDLIEIKNSQTELDVKLRNPEYDLTKTIKQVLLSYQAGGNLFSNLSEPVEFVGYVSDSSNLPQELATYQQSLTSVLQSYADQAKGNFSFSFIDPVKEGGELANRLQLDHNLGPLSLQADGSQAFYFYLTLQQGNYFYQLPLENLETDTFQQNLEASIKRLSSDFSKTLAVVLPKDGHSHSHGAHPHLPGELPQFNQLMSVLRTDYRIVEEDLASGQVDSTADLLLVVAPHELDAKQVFAIDQFVMRGGTLVLATSPFSAEATAQSLSMKPYASGLEDWLRFQGVSFDQSLIMDEQNTAFPIPITRNIGGYSIQELMMLDYPYFIDMRSGQLNPDHPITGNLPQLTMAWASPIELDLDIASGISPLTLATSSPRSWASTSLQVLPETDANGQMSFSLPNAFTGPHITAVGLGGKFDSYFSENPLPEFDTKETVGRGLMANFIKKGQPGSRIILFSSNDFLRDQMTQLIGAASGNQYLGGAQTLLNTVDWALDDDGLSFIRSRGHFNRTLPPLSESEQAVIETVNYTACLFVLFGIGIMYRRREKSRLNQLASNISAAKGA